MKLIALVCCAVAFISAKAQQILPFSNYTNTSADSVSLAPESSTSPKVKVYGISGAEALQFEQIAAQGAISAEFLLDDHITANMAFSFGAQAIKNESADSVPLSLFYFPDIANTAFAGNIEFDLFRKNESTWKPASKKRHHFVFGIESSVQRRNIEKDTNVYQFGIFNVNAGPKYKWTYAGTNHNAVVTFAIYYNQVRINRNNSDAFNTLFNDYAAPATAPIKPYFHGISFMLSAQVDKLIFFGRTYSDLSQSHDLAVTVGIKAAADFFEF